MPNWIVNNNGRELQLFSYLGPFFNASAFHDSSVRIKIIFTQFFIKELF